MALTGFPDGPPTRGGGSLGDFIGGVFTAVGILTALHYRDRTGTGQMVDVSNMDAVFSMLDNWPTCPRDDRASSRNAARQSSSVHGSVRLLQGHRTDMS